VPWLFEQLLFCRKVFTSDAAINRAKDSKERDMAGILQAFLENEKGLRNYLYRLRVRAQDVEDLIQQAFLNAFAAELKADIGDPKAFLYRVAKNLAFTDFRKRRRNPSDTVEDWNRLDVVLDESQVAADVLIESRRKLALFAKAVAYLTPQCRRAFLLRRMDGLDYKQIASRMNISVSAVEKHVANGLVKCNAYLRAHGYDPTDFGAPSTPMSAARLSNQDE
jgi:RNA polymerase sigma factor (sigma-70 family)